MLDTEVFGRFHDARWSICVCLVVTGKIQLEIVAGDGLGIEQAGKVVS